MPLGSRPLQPLRPVRRRCRGCMMIPVAPCALSRLQTCSQYQTRTPERPRGGGRARMPGRGMRSAVSATLPCSALRMTVARSAEQRGPSMCCRPSTPSTCRAIAAAASGAVGRLATRMRRSLTHRRRALWVHRARAQPRLGHSLHLPLPYRCVVRPMCSRPGGFPRSRRLASGSGC